MNGDENKDPRDDEVEIMDLESPGQTFNVFFSQAVVRFVQRVHTSSKKPIMFAFLISLIVLLPAIQVGSSSIFRQISDSPGLARPSSQPPLEEVSAATGDSSGIISPLHLFSGILSQPMACCISSK